MGNKISLTFLRKIGRFAKDFLWVLVLTVLILGWILIGGLNLYCAIQLTCDAVSLNWWSMFISVFGLPILAAQMYLLRKTVEEGIWKPEISIGLINTAFRPDYIMELEKLPKHISVNLENFTNTKKIIIRNNGKTAAKSVKIQISVLQYSTKISAPQIEIDGAKYLSDIPVLIMEPNILIHAGDFNEFIFNISWPNNTDSLDSFDSTPSGSKSTGLLKRITVDSYLNKNPADRKLIAKTRTFSTLYRIGKYSFEVKIWADGMNPVREELFLEVMNFPDEITTEINRITQDALRYSESTRVSEGPSSA